MSLRNQAGIVLPGYNPLKVANAPTIGAVTISNAQVTVAFTAPSCVGGGAISSYTVFSNCGTKTASGASSPLTVTGLTNGTPYTFKVIATNVYGPSYPSDASASATPLNGGQQAYTTAGTYSWVAPACVTSVSVLAVGGGGGGGSYNNGGCAVAGGGGGGGALGYKNNYAVTPGSSYTVVVGAGGTAASYPNGFNSTCGADSYFVSTAVVKGGKGLRGVAQAYGTGGTYTGDGGGNGGRGGTAGGGHSGAGGGGGAGGYSGTGGQGGSPNPGAAGAGGGGGGGGNSSGGFGGGGVGLLGQGCSGASASSVAGNGGSSGANGSSKTANFGGAGGAYGGGGGASYSNSAGAGGVGAVRIIWPGCARSFPSTNTGNL